MRLSTFDLALVAVYLVAITLFGLRFREKKDASGTKSDKSLKSYFLANNTIPWWAIALSIVSAETSTLTIISVPGIAFAGNFGFLQLVIGYMLGRIVVALLFLPRYFAGEMLTAYQLIDRRFGPVLHKVTAGLFLLTRAAAEGVRVFAVSIVVGIAIGTRDILSIGIISALTLLYTFEGGMTAVIWTDVVQMILYIGGTLVAIFTLGSHVPGGWAAIHTVAGAGGKFHMLDFTLNLTSAYTFWAGVLGGTFLTMASHGTDQLMVQRMLAARNLRESRLALLSSGAVIFLQFTLFLLIGAGLYVFYGQHPAAFASSDRIFPTFIVREMPIGVAGLLVAAILAAAMSNLSAALNSLSSTTVVDFYMRLRPHADDRERAIISKSSTFLWALILFSLAVVTVHLGGKGHVVEIGLSIASVAYGCLLGVFLLGTLTKFATEIGTTIGMVCGFALNLWLWQGAFPKVLWQGDVGYNCKGVGFDCEFAHVIIPHIAYPWYTIIGTGVTFAIGSLASLLFRTQSRRATLTHTAGLALFCAVILNAVKDPRIVAAQTSGNPFMAQPHRDMSGEAQTSVPSPLQTPDFSPIDTLLNAAIAAHKLPGAVVLVGSKGKVVFHHAYGNRKLAGEPGLDGAPSAAEPMTEDTIFDMASLTKCLATATAIMQLYEQGKIASFDDPISKYFPDFLNTAVTQRPDSTSSPATTPHSAPTSSPSATPSAEGAPTYQPEPKAQVQPAPNQRAEGPAYSAAQTARARVTLRMLLTHTSGEAPDVDLKDPWGLAAPDRAEGIHRALTTALTGTPGAKFVYSDINFILLGLLVEKVSGLPEDIYVATHIYNPLKMAETRYLAFDKVCGMTAELPTSLHYSLLSTLEKDMSVKDWQIDCDGVSWTYKNWAERTAPTAHDDESKSNPSANPDFDHLLRAVVHDPTTRRMGGVAGHAGLFSTAHDVSLYAQALLDKLVRNTGPFPLKQSTLKLMTQPQQPGANLQQLPAANAAQAAAIAAGDKPAEPGLAPHYPAVPSQNLRGFGWDIDTGFSKPRGVIFPIGSFGHTGFTGTSLWMDPATDTYVILLANAIHPRGGLPISNLRGEVATAAAHALGLDANSTSGVPRPESGTWVPNPSARPATPVLTGIDVLQSTHFAALTALAAKHNNRLRLGLLTNQAGIDRNHRRTVDILHSLTTNNIELTTIFSPEHGLAALADTENVPTETDAATGLHVTGLYGAKPGDRRPTHDQLKDLDAVVIDLQDAGVHFWTYEAAMGYFLEASAREEREFDHRLDIVILDRPNLVGGIAVQGPVSDPGIENYTNYMPLPARHGMTFGELARYFNQNKLDASGNKLDAPLTIVRMQNYARSMFFPDTGLPWTNPSPNLRDPIAATLYPGIGLIETTNISVGRGTAEPFHLIGAAWLKAAEVASALSARHIPGITFTPTTIAVQEDSNKYPFHGQTIEAVRFNVIDHNALDTPELGIEILAVLQRLYPAQFQLQKAMRLIDNQATLDALQRGDDPHVIAHSWQPALDAFQAKRAQVLLY